jgi:hypothetical protein
VDLSASGDSQAGAAPCRVRPVCRSVGARAVEGCATWTPQLQQARGESRKPVHGLLGESGQCGGTYFNLPVLDVVLDMRPASGSVDQKKESETRAVRELHWLTMVHSPCRMGRSKGTGNSTCRPEALCCRHPPTPVLLATYEGFNGTRLHWGSADTPTGPSAFLKSGLAARAGGFPKRWNRRAPC